MKYIRFYFDHWACSTRMLDLEGKGAWMELMVAMSTQPVAGRIEASLEQIARLWGVTAERAHELLEDLQMANVCMVTFGDKISVQCNELTKAAEDYKKFVEQRRENGKAGGQASAQARAKASAKPRGQPRAKPRAKQVLKHTTKLLTTTNSKELGGTPSLDEVKKFCKERSIPESRAEAFYNYYEGRNMWFNSNKEPINWWFMIQNKPWNEDRQDNGKNGSGSLRVNRNSGTANDGDFSEFANVGKVAGA